jgi:hypothetical protein
MNLGLFYPDLRIRVKFYPVLIHEFASLMGHPHKLHENLKEASCILNVNIVIKKSLVFQSIV